MTRPRRILPGTRYLITRRCSERRHFLRPDHQVTQLFEYLLGWLSKKHRIQLHGYVVMSNHYHLVLTDTEGRLPKFQQDLNSMLARAINVFRNRSESLWDRESYNAVELLEGTDVIRKIAYTEANPTAARLVNRARQWEGATSPETIAPRLLQASTSSRGLSQRPLAAEAEPPPLTPNGRLAAPSSPKSFAIPKTALDLGLARARHLVDLVR